MTKSNNDFSDKQIARLQSLFVASEDRLKTEMKDYVYASEQRIKTELRSEMRLMGQEIRSEMRQMKTEVIEGVADLLDNVITPRSDDHERRIVRLEGRVLPA